MNILFKNTTSLTLDTYQTFLQFHGKKQDANYYFITAFFSLLLVFCATVNLQYGNLDLGYLFLLASFVFLIWRFFYPHFQVTKEVASDKIAKELVNTFCFYDSYFTILNREGNSKLSYLTLYRAYETPSYFYLYLDKQHALLLDKKNFSIGSCVSFSTFLKEKLKWKYRLEIK